MLTSLPLNKQSTHQGGGGQRHPDGRVDGLIRPARVPAFPEHSARTLFSPVAGVRSLPGETGSAAGAGLSPPGGSGVLFSLLRSLANTSKICVCVCVCRIISADGGHVGREHKAPQSEFPISGICSAETQRKLKVTHLERPQPSGKSVCSHV